MAIDERGERTFGGVGTKMLFENERIRVWEMRLAPGERSELHEHHHDYAMIQIAGDRVAADFEPDSKDGWNGAEVGRVEGEVANGTVIFAEKGGKETAVNIGDQPFYEIIVELKD
jgi:beta-alanine degradation protein BauB